MTRHPQIAVLPALLVAALLASCGEEPQPPAPTSGSVTLKARNVYGYEQATFSFEHATAEDSDKVLNDWDLLFGNDQDPARDLFSVNLVTDDDSFIVDLGEKSFADVPEQVDPALYPVGEHGKHDDIPVAVGHLYVVRTIDSNTRQWAAFKVTAHELNEQVTISWVRSPEAERFVAPQE